MRSTDAVIPYMWAVSVMYPRPHGPGPGRVAVAVLCLRRGSHARAHRQQGSHARAHLVAGSHDVIPAYLRTRIVDISFAIYAPSWLVSVRLGRVYLVYNGLNGGRPAR